MALTATDASGNTATQAYDVDVPVSTVYNQWTQFEEFPEFMEGVEQIQQIDDRKLHWVCNVAGHRHEWDAEIYEQVPDQRIDRRQRLRDTASVRAVGNV